MKRSRRRQIIAVITSAIFGFQQIAWAEMSQANQNLHKEMADADPGHVQSLWSGVQTASKTPVKGVIPANMEISFTCNGAPHGRCVFSKTIAAAEKKRGETETYKTVTCSPEAADGLTGAVSSIFNALTPNFGASVSAGVSATGTATTASSLAAHKGTCIADLQRIEAELDAEMKEAITADEQACIAMATTVRETCYATLSGTCGAAPTPACLVTAQKQATASHTANLAAIARPKAEGTSTWAAIKGALKEYGFLLIPALAGMIMLITSLSKSSDKQKNQFQTNSLNGKPTNTKPPAKNKDPGILEASRKDETTLPINTGVCKGEIKPLECLVTSLCNLNCVAKKLGVPNYAGMDRDTTRVDKNGNLIDATQAGMNKNPGVGSRSTASETKPSTEASASSGAGGGSGGGGKGGPSVSPGEQGSSSSDTQTKSLADYGSFGDGADGYGGAGFGGGDSDPASRNGKSDRYKAGQDEAARKGTLAHSMANGPILPMTSNLFERIWNTSRTQCLRDLVICHSK